MKITHDHPKEKGVLKPVNGGEMAKGFKEKWYEPYQQEAIDALLRCFYDMSKMVVSGWRLTLPSYEVSFSCESREEFDWVHDRCMFFKHQVYPEYNIAFAADEQADKSDWVGASASLPGDQFRLWVRVGEDSYIGINCNWIDEPETEVPFMQEAELEIQY